MGRLERQGTDQDAPVHIAIRRAEMTDLDAASGVLGRAFADYPWTRWTVDPDDHVRRVTELQRLALECLGLPYGQVWVAVVDGDLGAVSVWMDSRVTVPADVSEEMKPRVAELEGSRHEASLSAESAVAGSRPEEPHYYLAVVGTDPSVRRRGLAAGVIRPGLAASDADGIPSFLHTSAESNVAWYSKLGFDVTGHQQVDEGGPDVWAMSRRPIGPAESRE